jgi:hypothetical protein
MTTELDENGDMLFRFRLTMPTEESVPTLTEFYRHSIRDMLKVVRFFSNGKPVLVDSFAFLNEPTKQIKILE